MQFSKLLCLGGFTLASAWAALAKHHDRNDAAVTEHHHFHMALDFPETKLGRRTTAYVDNDGFLTFDQSVAAVFRIINGQLESNGEYVSASPTDPYIVFVVNSTLNSISTTWTRNAGLEWFNTAFTGNGIAKYCQGSDTRIYLVLQYDPSQCEPANATPVPTYKPSNSTSNNVSSTTSTSTSAATPTANGIAYYGYKDPSDNATPDLYNGNPSVDITGVAQDINFILNDDGDGTWSYTFPGQNQATDATDYSILYQGYFLAPIESFYTLTSPGSTDNEAWIWSGDNAYSAWNNSNYDGASSYPNQAGSARFKLKANETTPITILWANIGGPGSFYFTILTEETGKTDTSTAGYFTLPIPGDGFSNSGFSPPYREKSRKA